MVLAIGSGRRRSAVDIWGADGALGAGGESVVSRGGLSRVIRMC